MKERPILFSGPMVRAILAGTKTQTRRVMRPQPIGGTPRRMVMADDVPEKWQDCDDARELCPYGVTGERLWVREAFRQGDGSMSVHYRADPDEVSGGPWRPSIFMPRWASRLTLEVTEVRVQRLQEISVEDVKAEGVALPVHKFSETQGAPLLNLTASPSPSSFSPKHPRDWDLADYWRHAFAVLWDGINGKRAPWASNPWVWAVTFARKGA